MAHQTLIGIKSLEHTARAAKQTSERLFDVCVTTADNDDDNVGIECSKRKKIAADRYDGIVVYLWSIVCLYERAKAHAKECLCMCIQIRVVACTHVRQTHTRTR